MPGQLRGRHSRNSSAPLTDSFLGQNLSCTDLYSVSKLQDEGCKFSSSQRVDDSAVYVNSDLCFDLRREAVCFVDQALDRGREKLLAAYYKSYVNFVLLRCSVQLACINFYSAMNV